jgi:uncharacterized membrane protein HdeD (DUF308 family)
LLGGIVLIILGIVILVYPDVTLAILVLIVGVFLIIEGILDLLFGFTAEAKAIGAWWIFLLKGIIDIVVGVLILVSPDITLMLFIYLVAAWAIIWGILELAATVKEWKEVEPSAYGTGGKWVGFLIGLIAIVFGSVLAVYPATTLSVIIWLVGFLVIIAGIMIAIISFGTRKTRA